MEPSNLAPPVSGGRLLSLDAYRGFVMLAMVSGGLGLFQVAQNFPNSSFWQLIAWEFEHVPWRGCAVWDLIQPSFMFIVGVAMPYSYAARRARGFSPSQIARGVLFRSAALILLGIFLRSNGDEQTDFTFEDVVTQIGLGYAFVYLTLGRGIRVQAAVLVAVLVGYWMLFALWPLPTESHAAASRVPDDWRQFTGFAAHWNKHLNPAGAFDRWFLNQFPRPDQFVANSGGYQTLSFIPSMGTILFGVMAGELLLSQRTMIDKVRRLLVASAICFAAGIALDPMLVGLLDDSWSISPVVKRIWTPSWAVFSTGWTLLLLAAFVWLIEVRGWRKWTFPLVVVGKNSVAMYVMSWLVKPWLRDTLHTHLGDAPFAGDYGPLIESIATVSILWLICLWLYRNRIFLRL